MATKSYTYKTKTRRAYQLILAALFVMATGYFLLGSVSAEGRFKSFADDFFQRLAAELDPTVMQISQMRSDGSSWNQSYHTRWRKSKDRFGDDNSRGAYFHTIIIGFRDEPERWLIISIDISFQEIPDGYVLPSGRSKGWTRIGEIDVEATMRFGIGSDAERSRTRIPNRTLSPKVLQVLVDQVTEAVHR